MTDIITSAGGFLLAIAYIFLGYLLGYVVACIGHKRIRAEYLDAATNLWLAATMVNVGASEYEKGDKQDPRIRQVLVCEIDLNDLKDATKKMEEAMRRHEDYYE